MARPSAAVTVERPPVVAAVSSIPAPGPRPRLVAGAASQKLRLPQPLTHPAAIAATTVVGAAAPTPERRRTWLRRPHATAEMGLGTTVLGVLGLIALPIALVGLLLSGGGLVWALVAGLAAVAVLVAYLDPFGQ